jgi:hypothetical protein
MISYFFKLHYFVAGNEWIILEEETANKTLPSNDTLKSNTSVLVFKVSFETKHRVQIWGKNP